MMTFGFTFLLALLLLALPAAQAAYIPIPRAISSNGEITLSQLNTIIGGTKCSLTSSFLDECRTAAQALPFVNKGFSDYNITSLGEKAAMLSLMAFESGGFQFNVNHFPGRPGQGTRNLMEFPSIYQYALSQPFLSHQTLALVPNHTVSNSYAALSNSTKNAILSLVLSDNLSFASAMWFYTQSGTGSGGKPPRGCLDMPGMVSGLQAQTEKGWENYIESCVGTSVTNDRKQGYLKTLKVLKQN
ncbi:hypothetical protein D9757_009421 [Collybiopsis confluens]|uniref:Uncharacterized protein n=1 Tax=Collybiopsis confluens TaxID=2823264 RepID=A0A8H5M507_9AGAR|nr:hypothetical protein D9757_009421 [Collybiopsis confluens]